MSDNSSHKASSDPSDKDAEIITMTTDEIKADIEKKLKNGKTYQQVRKEYREMGVDINTVYRKETAKRDEYPYDTPRRRFGPYYLMGLGSVMAAFGIGYPHGGDGTLLIIMGVIMTLSGLAFRYYLKSQE